MEERRRARLPRNTCDDERREPGIGTSQFGHGVGLKVEGRFPRAFECVDSLQEPSTDRSQRIARKNFVRETAMGAHQRDHARRDIQAPAHRRIVSGRGRIGERLLKGHHFAHVLQFVDQFQGHGRRRRRVVCHGDAKKFFSGLHDFVGALQTGSEGFRGSSISLDKRREWFTLPPHAPQCEWAGQVLPMFDAPRPSPKVIRHLLAAGAGEIYLG
nr:hypothetical protein [Pandoravirus massiliensis]